MLEAMLVMMHSARQNSNSTARYKARAPTNSTPLDHSQADVESMTHCPVRLPHLKCLFVCFLHSSDNSGGGTGKPQSYLLINWECACQLQVSWRRAWIILNTPYQIMLAYAVVGMYTHLHPHLQNRV
jgi:hypothetical protein